MKQLHKKLKIIQRLGKNICKTSASKFSTQYIWKIYTNKWQTIQDQKTNGFHKRRNLNGQWAHVCLIHLGQIFLALTVSMASGPAPDIAKVTNEVTVANFMQTQSCETQNHFSPPFPGTCLLIVRKQSTPLQPRGMWRLVFPGMSLWPLIVRSHTGQKFHTNGIILLPFSFPFNTMTCKFSWETILYTMSQKIAAQDQEVNCPHLGLALSPCPPLCLGPSFLLPWATPLLME
jgi:hypothetical protein